MNLYRLHFPKRHFGVILALLGFSYHSLAIDFEKDVFPIIEANCLDCHDGETLKGGIGLDSFYHATQPTDAGEALFLAGKPEESVLLHVVEETDLEKRMPPKGDPLTKEEIKILKGWIEAGAVWPDDGWRPPVHWSFLSPARSDLPTAGDSMLNGRSPNEIDHYIAAKLAAQNLELNPETDPSRLLRRAYLDIVGLPPTPKQVNAFLVDPSIEHYTKIVDELLASPRYGEKWAVPWLDLARYADSEGYQRDSPRNMWPWRDWVIEALNTDMPFDQFSIEQLAGDLLPSPTESQIVATGFHRNAPMNLEAGTDPKEDHYKRNVDRVNTTGTIWLGLTVGCAQCHNHKYDPVSAKEYYELYAFFNNTPMESKQKGAKMGMSAMVHIGPTLLATKTTIDEVQEKVVTKEYQDLIGGIRKDILAQVDEKVATYPNGQEALPEDIRKILDSDKSMNLAQCRTVSKKLMPKDTEISHRIALAGIQETRLKEMRKKEVRIMEEMEKPRDTFIAKRGDFLTQGSQVAPATPSSLHPFEKELSRDRLGLAKWLVDPANPLVGRAFVNRLWIEVFGQGLVTTPEDFGMQGELPTHPELLDWLAIAFVEEDQWSMKKALRRIVLSTTYRQSIAVRESVAETDPRNQLLWRHPGHRFRAETIRDQALAIGGLLSAKQLGAPVRPYQPATFWRKTAGASETYYIPSQGEDAYRRGVYTLWRRNAHYPSFANFDAPDRAACVVQRDRSNTPLQSLTLLNDPVYVEVADAFAKRIQKEGGVSIETQIEWAVRTALTRKPREPEAQLLHSAFTSVLGESQSKEKAYREIATIILNLHETITRS